MTSSSYAPPPDAGLLQTSDDEPIRPSPRRGCCAWRRAAVRRRHAAGQVAARGYRPWLLAGLLYMGSGLGLTLWRMLRRGEYRARLAHGEWPWLAGAVLFGGVLGPVLLMWGLVGMPASGAALLFNAEGVFTAVIACQRAWAKRGVPRKRRSPHLHRHAGHRRRRGGAELARAGPVWRCAARDGRAWRLPGLGHGQQPHTQGFAKPNFDPLIRP